MRRLLLLLLFTVPFPVSAQPFPQIIHWEQMESLINPQSDTLYVINFWATWCKPCVEELPVFYQAAAEYKDRKVRFLFVSLDFKKDFNGRLSTFYQKNMQSREVYLLDEPDYNSWIEKIDTAWQGAIPATLFVRGSLPVRRFYESSFTFEELNKAIKSTL